MSELTRDEVIAALRSPQGIEYAVLRQAADLLASPAQPAPEGVVRLPMACGNPGIGTFQFVPMAPRRAARGEWVLDWAMDGTTRAYPHYHDDNEDHFILRRLDAAAPAPAAEAADDCCHAPSICGARCQSDGPPAPSAPAAEDAVEGLCKCGHYFGRHTITGAMCRACECNQYDPSVAAKADPIIDGIIRGLDKLANAPAPPAPAAPKPTHTWASAVETLKWTRKQIGYLDSYRDDLVAWKARAWDEAQQGGAK